jgi:outer membrane receptor protein involved in Fe transport
MREKWDVIDGKGRRFFVDQAADVTEVGAYGQIDFNFTPKLRGSLSARWGQSDLNDDHISPKAALVYSFNDQNSLRLTASQGYLRPDFINRYLYVPRGYEDLSHIEDDISQQHGMELNLGFEAIPKFSKGNEHLEVEEITSYEIGWVGLVGNGLRVTLSYYYDDLTNFITSGLPGVHPDYPPYQPPSDLPQEVQQDILDALEDELSTSEQLSLSNDPDTRDPVFLISSYGNAGQAHRQGVELALAYPIKRHWLIEGNYTWLDFRVDDEDAPAWITANAPDHRVNLAFSYLSPKFDATLRYRWVNGFYWYGGTGYWGPVPTYNLFDFIANANLGKGYTVGLNISNLLNHPHYQAFGGDVLGRRGLVSMTVRW